MKQLPLFRPVFCTNCREDGTHTLECAVFVLRLIRAWGEDRARVWLEARR